MFNPYKAAFCFWWAVVCPPGPASGYSLKVSPNQDISQHQDWTCRGPAGSDHDRFVDLLPLEEWTCVQGICQPKGLCRSVALWLPCGMGRWAKKSAASRAGMGVSLLNKTLSDKRDGLAAEHLQWCMEPWEITCVLIDFYKEFKVKNARPISVWPFAKYFHIIATNQQRKMANPVDFWENWHQDQMLVHVFKTHLLCQGLETCNSSLLPLHQLALFHEVLFFFPPQSLFHWQVNRHNFKFPSALAVSLPESSSRQLSFNSSSYHFMIFMSCFAFSLIHV